MLNILLQNQNELIEILEKFDELLHGKAELIEQIKALKPIGSSDVEYCSSNVCYTNDSASDLTPLNASIFDRFSTEFAWFDIMKSASNIDFQITSILAETSDWTKNEMTQAKNLMVLFDQHLGQLFSACENGFVQQLTTHFEGQFCLHVASLIFKQEEAEAQPNWTEAKRNTLPMLLLAYRFGVLSPSTSTDRLFGEYLCEEATPLFDLWHAQSNFRTLQAAQTLNSFINDKDVNESRSTNVIAILKQIHGNKYCIWGNENDVLHEVLSMVEKSNWRVNILKQIFNEEEDDTIVKQSFFVRNSDFDPKWECIPWPCMSSLCTNFFEAINADQSNLPYIIYLLASIAAYNISNIPCLRFEQLQYSVPNLEECSIDTFNQLDIDSFLFAISFQVHQRSQNYTQPIRLYNNMVSAGHLCNNEQIQWWSIAYQVNICKFYITDLLI